jgi:hypothetical protein
MWETPDGFRTLEGAEAKLVRQGIIFLVDQIQQEIEYGWPVEYGIPLFDELPPHQKIVVLSGVANAMLRPEVEAPERCAVDDSAVAAIFEVIKIALESEIEFANEHDNAPFWTDLVLACPATQTLAAELGVDEKNRIHDTWYELVDAVRDSIIADDDWTLARLFLDGRPDRTRSAAIEMGITEDYFVTPAPDPTDDELPVIINGLDELLATA